jgi:hypothetical protein
MTSLALADRAAGKPRGLSRSTLLERHGSDVLLAALVLGIAAVLFAFLPGAFSVDSWLALVAGRDVWSSGLPHHETLTALSQGHAWVDQQWLSELTSYALYRIGGLGLLGLTNVALVAISVGGAVIGARRLGASARSVMVVLPLCLWLAIPSREVRTQEFVLPLFVATTFLLARDSRAPSRAVLWCLPLLVLWGNLHGTVTLGVGLVALRGLTILWEQRRKLTGHWKRPLALIIGAPACLLITPYGAHILTYYHTMFLQSSVRHTVTEWQPITSAWLVAVPFFLGAGLALWSFGRNPHRTTPWEQLALIALAAGSVLVIRNVLFFALAAIMILPLSLGLETKPARARPYVNAAVALGALAAVLIGATATLTRPASAYEFHYQRAGVLATVRAAIAADPQAKVLADVRFADWLLWRDPGLRGRIANDARFELLSGTQAMRLQRVYAAAGIDWKAGARGFRLIVLDRAYEPDTVAGFAHEPGARVLYDDGERLVILRTASAAR